MRNIADAGMMSEQCITESDEAINAWLDRQKQPGSKGRFSKLHRLKARFNMRTKGYQETKTRFSMDGHNMKASWYEGEILRQTNKFKVLHAQNLRNELTLKRWATHYPTDAERAWWQQYTPKSYVPSTPPRLPSPVTMPFYLEHILSAPPWPTNGNALSTTTVQSQQMPNDFPQMTPVHVGDHDPKDNEEVSFTAEILVSDLANLEQEISGLKERRSLEDENACKAEPKQPQAYFSTVDDVKDRKQTWTEKLTDVTDEAQRVYSHLSKYTVYEKLPTKLTSVEG